MTLEELREISRKLDSFSDAIHVKLSSRVDRACLTVYSTTNERHEAIIDALRPHLDEFLSVEVLRVPGPFSSILVAENGDIFLKKNN